LVLTFLVLPFWYLLTRVDPDIFQTSSKTVVCVCVCVLWHCWLGGRKVVICPGQGADLHMVQLMPLPFIVSCSIKSKLDKNKREVKRVCVCDTSHTFDCQTIKNHLKLCNFSKPTEGWLRINVEISQASCLYNPLAPVNSLKLHQSQ